MHILSQYLQKLEKFMPYEPRVRTRVIRAVQDILGIALKREQVQVSHKVVFINGPAALKAELFLKQDKLINHIKTIDPGIVILKII